jgi:superfamily I DNA/RNA helicase
MNPIKRIIIEETAKVLKEMKHRKKIKDVASNLYESVKTADMVKDNPKKYRLAKKLVSISENKFIKERQRLKESNEYEDESEMAKAQLAAIIEKSEELLRMMNGVNQLEDWLQYKLSIAENYIDAVHGYIKYFNGEDDMEYERPDEDEMEWDEVEEEDFNDEDAEYFDDEEDFEDFEDFGDFDDEYDFEEDEEEDDFAI